ncbi:MAG TPA: carboxypeptidase-like regulatory domain-containing protein, partial [Pyrinomonadaceae bacterium]|nr:carboxypeptidase-like regulatory domain-containing protein [Pyrinomonadaceae bacterium]
MNAKTRASGRIIAVALALILHASAAAAQQPGGALRGRVVDPAGAVIQGATVTVTDAAGKDKTATTDGEGVYTIAALPPGTYSVRVTATGFAPSQGTEVEIASGGRKTLDLELEVTVKENVDVPASDGRLSVEPETT